MENEQKKDLVVVNPVSYVLDTVKSTSVIKPEDMKFLMENREHLFKVMERSWIWRTEVEKRSIISDSYKPTLHAKFHQTLAEQKVQFDQAMYLAKGYEEKKLEVEELELDLESLQEQIETSTLAGDIPERDIKRWEIQAKKLQIDIQFKNYELKQAEIAMKFRMDEVRGWKKLQDELVGKMMEQGMDEESIWNKQLGEVEDLFFMFLNNLQGIRKSTDGGEYNNLVALATFAVKQAQEAGIYEGLVARCNPTQLNSLQILKQLGVIQ